MKGALPSRPKPNSLKDLLAFDIAIFADKLGSRAGRVAKSTETAVKLEKPLPGVRF